MMSRAPDDVRPAGWSPRLGQHLEAARTRALLGRAQLASRLGVTEESIRRWEQGGARPTPEHLSRLIAVLSLDSGKFSDFPSDEMDLPPLARRLRHERLARQITQMQAAALIGVAQPTYAGWEVGRASPKATHFPVIAEFVGATPEELEQAAATPFTVDVENRPPLGRLIGMRRQAQRLTRAELARKLVVSEASVTAWELGYRSPAAPQIQALALALGVTPSELEGLLPVRDLPALGTLIRSRQRVLGLRLRDLAERSGFDESTLSRWIHGHRVPGPLSLPRLSNALELPLSVLRRTIEDDAANFVVPSA